MMFSTHFRIALASLRSRPVRTALTTLGIVIGVTSITLVLALGEGARQTVSRQVQKLDDNIVVVKPGTQEGISAYNPFPSASTTTLTERDLADVIELEGVSAVAPLMFINGSVKNGNDAASGTPIIATSPELLTVLGLDVRSGQFLNNTIDRDTVVLGERLAVNLFGTNQARSQEVLIRGRPHTVVGILKATDAPLNLTGTELDYAVYVSLDNGKSFNQGIAQIQQLLIRADSAEQIASVATRTNAELLENHDGEKDFTVLEGNEIAQSSDGFFNLIVGVTAAVAGISLIVGGIGIMNIMLVSVSERTREVGIRKAIGATNSNILTQFVIEALLMTITGGIVGLVVAYTLAFFIANQLSFMPVLSWQIVTTALGLSVLVGVIFGVFPAMKAARKDPIAALRQYS